MPLLPCRHSLLTSQRFDGINLDRKAGRKVEHGDQPQERLILDCRREAADLQDRSALRLLSYGGVYEIKVGATGCARPQSLEIGRRGCNNAGP